MSPGLTPSQHDAVHLRDRDLCVVAGAGTGKTHVLTERIVQRVAEGLDLSQLLAITFTEKAAAQMKRRLSQALAQGTGTGPAWEDVERAAISTVHAFCARLLREHAVEAGVDPAFTVLDEVEGAALRRSALDALEDELAREAPADLEHLAQLPGIDPGDTFLAVYAAARDAPGALDAFVLRSSALTAGDALRDVEDAADFAASLRGDSTPAGGRLLDALAIARASSEGDDIDRLQRLRGSFSLRTGDPLKSALRELREVIDGALAVLAEEALVPLREALARCLLRYDRLYREGKGDGLRLDFADLERAAVDLLESGDDIRATIRRRWTDVFVDEFQDTNPIQSRLVDLLRPERSLFVVGDPKQAIYGFRGSDVGVFLRTRDRVVAEDAKGEVHLALSFRSRPQVLGAVNRLFASGFPPESGATIDYEPLAAAREFPEPDRPCVEVVAATGDDARAARRAEFGWIAERIQELVEGNGDDPPLPLTMRSTDDDGAEQLRSRPAAFGDVAVLLRAMTHVKLLEQALTARGIPYLVVKGRGFYAAREVVDLANLLACVDDPLDDLILAAVLRSPVCGLSDDALFVLCAERQWIREAVDEDADEPEEHSARGTREPLFDVIHAWRTDARPTEEFPADEASALRAFWDAFLDLRTRRARASLTELVDHALALTRLDVLALARPNGRQRAANLRKVRALAMQRDRAGDGSLDGLVTAMRELRAREVKETEAPVAAAAAGAVSILTIHASKGLEFPVVFVPDMARGTHAMPAAIHADGRDGLGLPAPAEFARRASGVTPAALAAFRDREKQRGLAEADRLLYVALTRAEEHLVLSGAIGKQKGARPWWDRLTETFGDPEGVEATRDLELTDPDCGVDAPFRVRLHPPVEAADAPAAPSRTLLFRASRELAFGRVPPEPIGAAAQSEAERLLAEASRVAPEPVGTLFATTVSALVLFAASPPDFARKHVFGLPDPDDLLATPVSDAFDTPDRAVDAPGDDDELPVSLEARARGRAVHAALERLVPEFAEDVETVVRDCLSVETAGAPVDPAQVRTLVKWVEDFRDSPTGREVASVPRDRVRREQAFLFDHERTVVRGQLDLVYRSDQGWVVVDYKAGRFDDPPDDYVLQMRLYALAIRAVTGETPVRLELFRLPDAAAVVIPCSEADLDALRDGLLSDFARRTKANDYAD